MHIGYWENYNKKKNTTTQSRYTRFCVCSVAHTNTNESYITKRKYIYFYIVSCKINIRLEPKKLILKDT